MCVCVRGDLKLPRSGSTPKNAERSTRPMSHLLEILQFGFDQLSVTCKHGIRVVNVDFTAVFFFDCLVSGKVLLGTEFSSVQFSSS